MNQEINDLREELFKEIQEIPTAHLPDLLKIVRDFRESIAIKSAEESFRQGWNEALRGEVEPIEKLWFGIFR